MPHYTIWIISRWTLLLGLFASHTLLAETNPPVLLSNPSGCNLGLPIKDFSCDASNFFQINVTNAPGSALGQNVYLKEVRLIIAHKWAADLDVTLFSPNDVGVELTTDNGSGQNNYGDPNNCDFPTIFISGNSSNACSTPNITTGAAPFIGEYLPEGSFRPFHDGTNPNGIWGIRVCDDGKEHVGTLEYVELVFAPNDCLNPTVVEVVSVDSTSVLLNWVPGSNCDSSFIEFGISGAFTPGTSYSPGAPNLSSVLSDSCPPVRVLGLSPTVTYDVFIRDKCSNSFSINSCPVSFTTTCSPPNATVKEDFNSQNNCTTQCGVPCQIEGFWHNSLIDDFDWIVGDKTNIPDFGTGPSDDNPGGGKYIYIETTGTLCRSGRRADLMSNCMLVKAGTDSCDLSFDYLLNGVHVNALLLEYKEFGSTSWQLLDRIAGNQGPNWQTKFLDLDFLNGKSVQFRFRALGGSGSKGDIALDNIIFYGSQDLGPPPFVYYQDFDGDGYGGQTVFYATCESESAAPGFVDNNTDCDDDNFFANPGMEEFPCNGIDDNCNGMGDEDFFASPLVKDTTICSGASASFQATSVYGGQIVWFSDSIGMDTVFVGQEYLPAAFPTNYGSNPLTLTLYAQEFLNPVCFSSSRSRVDITILPQPDINTTDSPVICAGESFDLSTVDVIDNNGANGLISYHDNPTPGVGDTISPIVYPDPGQTFYIASTPVGGCTDIIAVSFTIKESPAAQITGEELVCKNTLQTLQAVNTASGNTQLPLSYNWNTGDTTQSIPVSSHPFLGGFNTYTVEMTAPNGCSSADTLTVTTISNINSVQRIVENVTQCDGNDGSISLLPLDGTPPYTFRWGNGQSQTGNSLVLQNLSQGAYSFTITDSSPQGCQFVIPLMTVDGPGAVVASFEVKPASCKGGTDGRITLNINGNNPVITWQDGSSNDTLSNLSAGLYKVTISDGACQNELEFEVREPELLTVSPSTTQPRCFGQSNGSIFLNTFGGTPPYQFNWQNGLATQGIYNVGAGLYPVTISDSRGCTQEIPNLYLREPDPIYFDTTALFQPTCNGFNDGKISIKPRGGTSPFDVDWGNGAMGTTINNVSAGAYVVTIKDANGCLFNQTLTLEQPAALNIAVNESQAPSCKGKLDGNIAITVSGGTTSYSFLWNNNDTEEDLENLPEGNYVVQVTDANSCQVKSDTIKLIGPELIEVNAIVTNPICKGQNSGSIDVCMNPVNGGSYSYNWSFDETNCQITNLSPGSYTVTITDNQTGCKIDSMFIITAPQVMSLNVVTEDPACFNNADGQIYLNPAGGTQPLTCKWSDVTSTDCIRTDLKFGNYQTTITDANGCTIASEVLVLNNPDPIEIKLATIDNPTCYGDSTGIIEVLATGGTGSLIYDWSNGETNSTVSGLGEGIYFLSLQDENNCSVNQYFEINWPPPLEAEQKRFVSGCNTLDSIDIFVTGGTAPYQYLWNHGDTGHTLVNVPVGDYTITISDQANCQLEVSSVKVPELVQAMYLQQEESNDSLCLGATNGTINISIDGGLAPYQYIWQHGITGVTNNPNLTINNLSPGNYKVTITDSDGCVMVSQAYPVIEGTAISANVSQLKSVSCKGEHDGAASIIVVGGFPDYDIRWENEEGVVLSDSASLDGVASGTYLASITDVSGCESMFEVFIPEPEFLLTNEQAMIEPPVCFGDANASINISPAGGTKPYNFLWSNMATTEDVTNLVAGSYTVSIIDANDCVFTDTFTVTGPSQPLQLDNFLLLEPQCFGDENGHINIQMAGGTPPYTYDWEISNDEDLENIGAGSYQLTVYDATNICLFDTTFQVSQPSLLEVDTSSTPAISSSNNGSATITGNGGTPPYQYLWESGDTTSTINNLPPGWYEYTVIDANLCSVIGGVQVNSVTAVIDQEEVSGYFIAPNPTSGNTRIELSLNSPLALEIRIFNGIGQPILMQEIASFSTGTIQLPLLHYPAGVYYVSIKSQGSTLVSDKIIKW